MYVHVPFYTHTYVSLVCISIFYSPISRVYMYPIYLYICLVFVSYHLAIPTTFSYVHYREFCFSYVFFASYRILYLHNIVYSLCFITKNISSIIPTSLLTIYMQIRLLI